MYVLMELLASKSHYPTRMSGIGTCSVIRDNENGTFLDYFLIELRRFKAAVHLENFILFAGLSINVFYFVL